MLSLVCPPCLVLNKKQDLSQPGDRQKASCPALPSQPAGPLTQELVRSSQSRSFLKDTQRGSFMQGELIRTLQELRIDECVLWARTRNCLPT